MAKNKNRLAQGQKSLAARPERRGISRRGWKVIGAGVATVGIGFVVLTFTDPGGQNWASVLSPFLLLGGYAAIGLGILLPDPEESAPSTPGLPARPSS